MLSCCKCFLSRMIGVNLAHIQAKNVLENVKNMRFCQKALGVNGLKCL